MSTLEPERGTGTGTLVEPAPQVSHGDGDHERFAHYVQKDKIMASALDGTPVVALCGKVGADGLPTRDAIGQQILLQKLEAAGRRYMRDLRRQATIDVKQQP